MMSVTGRGPPARLGLHDSVQCLSRSADWESDWPRDNDTGASPQTATPAIFKLRLA
jgi:hypothetical protein